MSSKVRARLPTASGRRYSARRSRAARVPKRAALRSPRLESSIRVVGQPRWVRCDGAEAPIAPHPVDAGSHGPGLVPAARHLDAVKPVPGVGPGETRPPGQFGALGDDGDLRTADPRGSRRDLDAVRTDLRQHGHRIEQVLEARARVALELAEPLGTQREAVLQAVIDAEDEMIRFLRLGKCGQAILDLEFVHLVGLVEPAPVRPELPGRASVRSAS